MTAPTPLPSAPRTNRLWLPVGVIAVLGVGAALAFSRSGAQSAKPYSLAQAMMEVRAENCSGRNLKGTGVQMEVFASSDLNGTPIQSGLVPVLDLNVTPSTPVQAGQTVRWTGWIRGEKPGMHHFQLPKGVSGTLNLSNADVITPSTPDSRGTSLEKARFYPFSLVVTVDKAATDAGTFLLSWSRDTDAPSPVTRGALFPPSSTTSKPSRIASR